MQQKPFRYLWGASLFLAAFSLVAASLACNLATSVGNDVQNVRDTAQSVATGVQAGGDLLATGQAVATQVLGSSLLQTAEAFATEQGPGIVATLGTFGTEQGPSFFATVQGFATQQGPGLIETVQALATDQGPAAIATGQAIATQLAASSGSAAPADIPLVAGDKQNLVATQSYVTYNTALNFNTVLTYYQQQMPANGWKLSGSPTIIAGKTAVLVYGKTGKTATVTLTGSSGNPTLVVISIQSK